VDVTGSLFAAIAILGAVLYRSFFVLDRRVLLSV